MRVKLQNKTKTKNKNSNRKTIKKTYRKRQSGGTDGQVEPVSTVDPDKFDIEFWKKLFNESYNKKAPVVIPQVISRNSRFTPLHNGNVQRRKASVPPVTDNTLDNVTLEKFKSIIIDFVYYKRVGLCDNIKRKIPKYETSSPYPDQLCILMLLIGFITKVLEKESIIYVKGGKAVELILSDIKQQTPDGSILKMIPPFVSNDIDIVVMPYRSTYSTRDIAKQIGYFIQWVTTPDGTQSMFSIKDLPKLNITTTEPDVGSIVKVSLIYNGFTAMVDIGYVLPEQQFNAAESSEEGFFVTKTVPIKEFDFEGFTIYYNIQNMKNMIMERIFYLIQYTALHSPDYPTKKFLDSLKRSTNALLYGLVVVNITANRVQPDVSPYLSGVIIDNQAFINYQIGTNDAELNRIALDYSLDMYYEHMDLVETPEKMNTDKERVRQFLTTK